MPSSTRPTRAWPAEVASTAPFTAPDGEHQEPELLASCYRTCLELAEQHGTRKVTFPSISTGIYGYPMADAAGIAMDEIVRHLSRPETKVHEVIMVLYDRNAYEVHAAQLKLKL